MTQMHTKIPEDSHLYARFFLVFPLPQEDKATADGNEATSENIGDVAIWQVTKQLKHIAYEVSNQKGNQLSHRDQCKKLDHYTKQQPHRFDHQAVESIHNKACGTDSLPIGLEATIPSNAAASTIKIVQAGLAETKEKFDYGKISY